MCRSFAVVFGLGQFGEGDGTDNAHEGTYAEQDAGKP
jgi:hypothetical protein